MKTQVQCNKKTTSSSKLQLRTTSPLDPSLHLALDPRWPPNAPGRIPVRPGCLPGEMIFNNGKHQ